MREVLRRKCSGLLIFNDDMMACSAPDEATIGKSAQHGRIAQGQAHRCDPAIFSKAIRSRRPFQAQKRFATFGLSASPKTSPAAIRIIAWSRAAIWSLPLFLHQSGACRCREIWTHWRGDHPQDVDTRGAPFLLQRSFRMNGPEPPFASNDMLGHIPAFGARDILCVWDLGVSEEILEACRTSYKS